MELVGWKKQQLKNVNLRSVRRCRVLDLEYFLRRLRAPDFTMKKVSSIIEDVEHPGRRGSTSNRTNYNGNY